MSTAETIQTERFMWQPSVDGLTHDVPIQVLFAEEALDPDAPQTHTYLGLGEGKAASKATIATLGSVGIHTATIILPFHHLECTPKNIELTVVEAPIFIAKTMNERVGRQATQPVSLLGHSQGGGTVLRSAGEAPELFDHVAAWAPVGLTPNAFGDTPNAKRNEFIRRLGWQNLKLPEQNPLKHPGNLAAGAGVMKQVGADWLRGRLLPKLTYALSLDLVPYTKLLVEHDVDVQIFGGETDPLFRINEYRVALGKVGLENLLVETPGSHTSPLVNPGKEQLLAVAKWLTGVRAKRDFFGLAS